MVYIQNRLDSINKRLNELNNNNNKIILEFITDFRDNKSDVYHKIKVVNIFDDVLYEVEVKDKPNKYLDNLIDKYKCNVNIKFTTL